MNVISGQVVVKETAVPLPGVLVVIYHLDTGTSPESVTTQPGPAHLPVAAPGDPTAATAVGDGGDRLCTLITDKNGQFTFEYEDADFQIRNPKEKRPNLFLMVLAPEDPGGTLQSRTLFTASGIRKNAGRVENYLIRIPVSVLTKAGVAVPLDPSVAMTRPEKTVGMMNEAMNVHSTLTQATKTLASQQVDAVRTSRQQLDALVESRLTEALTGVSADLAGLNVVPPGGNPTRTLWNCVNRTITNTVNASTMAGYVQLSKSEAQQFKDASGNFRDHIPAKEIERYIFQADDGKRPVTIVRADPLTSLSRQLDAPDPVVTPTDASGTTSVPGGDGQPPNQPVTTQDLPKFIGRLVGAMAAPEQIMANQDDRPTAGDVHNSVQQLEIGGGPADVTAFYDFHQLQIAFDYVWQHAIDEGVISRAQQLCQQLTDQGGDPTSVLKAPGDPIKALRAEVGHVSAAQTSMQSAGVLARINTNGSGHQTNRESWLPIFPPTHPPQRPAIVRPSFGAGVFLPPAPGDLLSELDLALKERYAFEVFAPGTTNFGLFITYRQRWDPETYQVGNLTKTLTLAPKETRKVTSKRTVNVQRSVKELQDNQRNRKDETSATMRDEAEIVSRAQKKTNFSLTAKGSFNIGIADGDSTTSLGRDAQASSQETKKQFHESVLKAAQEFKDEHKTEVETKTDTEQETTDSVELSNPNDELTVTYLFYELQRRYRVSEHIHRLTPVVLVAMDVPNPNRDEIDMVLLKNAWVINRVLLDDRYRSALDYLCTRSVGDELALEHLLTNLQQVAASVSQLQQSYRDLQAELRAREAALQTAMEARAMDVGKSHSEGIFDQAEDFFLGSNSGQDPQAAQILEDAKRNAYERKVTEEKDLRMRLDAETATLNAANDAYAKAQAEHSNWLLQVAALRAHFKENILYYMQAIWNFTFRDQIFFSLCNVKVPTLAAISKTYSLKAPDHVPLSIPPKPDTIVLEVDAELQLNGNLEPDQDFLTLAEVADLDNPICYKGNCIVFPLKESNPLTDWMMMPYIDSELGLHDPDELGSWTPEDFAQYARDLQRQMKDQLSASDYAALQAQLQEQYRAIVSNPHITDDMVIVPTSSLYIEALPGTHPLLENFKLEHRALDVQKAKEDVRKDGLEALRYAARILGAELADPEVDKQVVVSNGANVIVPADA